MAPVDNPPKVSLEDFPASLAEEEAKKIRKNAYSGEELEQVLRTSVASIAAGAAMQYAYSKYGGKSYKGSSEGDFVGSEGGHYSNTTFATKDKLISHYEKHGDEFKGTYTSVDEYLQGARDVMNNGYKVEYAYKGETRTGYILYMGNNTKGKAKFAFVGTNNEGYITTFHTESGKTFWKLLNGENIQVINPK